MGERMPRGNLNLTASATNLLHCQRPIAQALAIKQQQLRHDPEDDAIGSCEKSPCNILVTAFFNESSWPTVVSALFAAGRLPILKVGSGSSLSTVSTA